MNVILMMALLGCESDYDRAEREWEETFGQIAASYQARDVRAEPEVAPDQVAGRKVFVDSYRSSDAKEPYEATTAAEVGLVVVEHVVHEAQPSVTYEGGAKGYAGEVTTVAWAHPEGKQVASMKWRCSPPLSTFQMVDLQTGSAQFTLDERCGGSREQRLKFGGKLVGAILPDGTNTDAAGTEAYLALAAKHAGLEGAPASPTPPAVTGRKVLLLFPEGDAWKVWQKPTHLPAEAMATSADEVGVLVYARITHEPKPSVDLGSGVVGFTGTARLTAVAVPEGTVVAAIDAACELPTPEEAAVLADILPERRCTLPAAAVRELAGDLTR